MSSVLYYVLLIYRPRLRFAGLAVGIVTGLIFGIAQQLRGAHFVSYDIWTAGLAWWVCTCWFYVFSGASSRLAQSWK